MTSALLKSINTKNQLYKEWIKTDVNDLDLYSRRKDEFKSDYNTLRRSIKEAKRLYYTHTFATYQNDIKQTRTISILYYTILLQTWTCLPVWRDRIRR